MSQQKYCWEQQTQCVPYNSASSYTSSATIAPSLFLFFILGIIIWTSQLKPKKKDDKSPEEQLFEAIGKFEKAREKTGKKTKFNYIVKDPHMDEKCKSGS